MALQCKWRGARGGSAAQALSLPSRRGSLVRCHIWHIHTNIYDLYIRCHFHIYKYIWLMYKMSFYVIMRMITVSLSSCWWSGGWFWWLWWEPSTIMRTSTNHNNQVLFIINYYYQSSLSYHDYQQSWEPPPTTPTLPPPIVQTVNQ